MADEIKPCGHHPDSGCTCRESDLKVLEQESYWGPYSSQADVILEKAKDHGMYKATSETLAVISEPVIWVERLAEHTFEYRIENVPQHAVDIINEILPQALELYLKKTKDYGGLSGGLGPKAPFVDMWRKMIKLKRALWDGEDLGFEQPEEIIQDFIGTTLNILGEMHAVRESSPS